MLGLVNWYVNVFLKMSLIIVGLLSIFLFILEFTLNGIAAATVSLIPLFILALNNYFIKEITN